MDSLFTPEKIYIFWLALGALLIFLEAMAVPGVGFLFAGLSAVTIGGLVTFGVLDGAEMVVQSALFLALTFVWAGILWIPFKNFQNKKKQNNFENIIGDSAVVLSDYLDKNEIGSVRWSGTSMRAIVDDSSESESIAKGARVEIVEIDGNLLKVK